MAEQDQPAFMPVMRELVRAYQAFSHYDAALLREEGLTTAQADILFTLGSTDGMTFKQLGERTLITKGTLTGVVDRLAGKGLVSRRPSADDGRSTTVVLTADGDRLFKDVFPRHIARLRQRFDLLGDEELEGLLGSLRRLRGVFD